MNKSDYKYPTFPLPDASLSFLASEHTIYDYAHLYGFCSRFRTLTSEYNISDSRPLALLSKSSDELTFVVAACYLLKIPFVPLNPAVTDSELQNYIKKINPAVFYTDDENSNRTGRFPSLSIPRQSMNIVATGNEITSPSSDPDNRFGYFFTSGSSGRPKVVPLKRRQIMFATHASAVNFKPDANRYWLLCLPLNHIGGISIILRSILYGSAIFRMDRFDEHQIRVFLSENRLFQIASLVPTMLMRLLDDNLFQLHLDFKALLLGGGPISQELIERSLERGIPIVSSYGMTETCAQIAANPMLQPRGFYTPKKSVGTVFKPNEVQIRDPETGSVMPANEHGEIWLRGPQVIDEYEDSELTARSFDADGWFKTGDVGHVNRQGQLFLKNRRTDRIISGGENIDPVEVESALKQIEGISEAAVTGIPDSEWGQKVVALVVRHSGDSVPNEMDISSSLKKKLSGFKIPKEFRFVQQIPKTSLGKIRRGELIKLFEG
ncbi:o-succinylbenzoate--CoA ligase [Rhodohalobacter sp. 8-1]|uniref:o-succinylbenzoate--CoA ligase n=1 Tax=Rhodohalobacter sp. 8-1 TaxID=3131972 RepID=UPI0030EDB215